MMEGNPATQYSPNGPMSPDGYGGFNQAGVIEKFLATGESFEDLLARAGLPREDAEDLAEIFRNGIAFQVPQLVLYAEHALVAAAGDGDKLKQYALASVTNARGPVGQMQPNRTLLKRFFGKGKTTSNALQ